MRMRSYEEVRKFILDFLMLNLKARGSDFPTIIADDCDLLLSGFIDSLGLLQLLGAIRSFCEQEIDFDALDAEQMTIVGPLCRFVSEQTSKR